MLRMHGYAESFTSCVSTRSLDLVESCGKPNVLGLSKTSEVDPVSLATSKYPVFFDRIVPWIKSTRQVC